jgi:diguanylate cyclase (GGDEF)-like protein
MRVLRHISRHPNEAAASAIAEAFRRRALGASWAELADFLGASETGNGRWSKPDVAALIRNPLYIGTIVTRDEFDAAQADTVDRQPAAPLASLDARSMLYNQQYFLAALVREVRRAHRARRRKQEQELALIAFDGDDFHEINAAHGLRAGDDVLAEIGARIRRALPRADALAAHYRGDEFVVLLPDAGLDRARSTAARLLAGLHARIDPVGPVTFSAGIAALRPRERADAFFARAQQAQRRAKQLGKNRVEVAE